jgi:hypothetical protein
VHPPPERLLEPLKTTEVLVPNLSLSSDIQPRILSSQLAAASAALSDALKQPDHRAEAVEQACEALEAFEILERGPTSFNVPRKIREKVHASLEALRAGRLELAHASLLRADGAFQECLTGETTRRRWTH